MSGIKALLPLLPILLTIAFTSALQACGPLTGDRYLVRISALLVDATGAPAEMEPGIICIYTLNLGAAYALQGKCNPIVEMSRSTTDPERVIFDVPSDYGLQSYSVNDLRFEYVTDSGKTYAAENSEITYLGEHDEKYACSGLGNSDDLDRTCAAPVWSFNATFTEAAP